MNLQEIKEQKDWWYLKDYNYVLDCDWINKFKLPAPYPSFVWWDEYKFKTPRLYFQVVIRKHTEERIVNGIHDISKFKYTVIIGGAISDVPLPIEIWEELGSPWKSGTSMYINCFYFGSKYKELGESYVGKSPGISSFLIKGFNDLNEAKQFAEMWKVKAIEDHKKHIEIDKEIMKLLK